MRTIIFSKDRACQLDALLRSIKLHDKSHLIDFTNVYVLFSASNNEYNIGYHIVREKFPKVNFVPETDFYNNVLQLINHKDYHTVFFVDDIIAYRDFNIDIEDIHNCLNLRDVICVSLRLGRNTDYNYQYNMFCNVPNFIAYSKFLMWNRNGGEFHFNYPYSVDGHIFNTEFIKDKITSCKFTFPNNLESELCNGFSTAPPYLMLCPQNSVIVNYPSNRVQHSYVNKYDDKNGVNSKELNKAYVNGKLIDINITENIRATHQNITLRLI